MSQGAFVNTVVGSPGNDVFAWGHGGVSDVIRDAGGIDALLIHATSSEIRLSAPNDNSLILSLGEITLTIENYFDLNGGHIEKLVFADGMVWGLAQVQEALSHQPPDDHPAPPPPVPPAVIIGTDGNDVLTGTSQGEVIKGLAGNDTLDGGDGDDLLMGGAGNDTYRWNGSGNDTIEDSSGDDTVRIDLDDHITWSYQVGSDDLILAADDGNFLTIKDFYSEASSIQRFVFSNGDVLTRADILERLPPIPHENPPPPPTEDPPPPSGVIIGTDGNDSLIGTSQAETIKGGAGNDALNGAGGNDVLVGGDGNDTLDGGAGDDLLMGGAGNDTYHWNGSGNDTIDDSSGDDTVQIDFDDHITWSSRVGSDDLILAADDGNFLTIKDFYSEASSIQRFVFSNGDVLTRADVLERLPPIPHEDPPPPPAEEPPPPSGVIIGTDDNDSLIGTVFNDTINGGAGNDLLEGGAGNDELIGGAGNDTLDGGSGRNTLSGGSGSDLYIFGRDSGHSEIFDAGGDNDAIAIDALSSEVIFEHVGQYLFIRLGTNGVAVRDYFSETDYGRIERLIFSNGEVWTRDDVLNAIGTPNPNPDPKPTPDPNPEPQPDPNPSPDPNPNPPPAGNEGNDLLTGTTADDTLDGGNGNDTLDGGAGSDLLIGGHGDDTFIWGAESGEDLIVDHQGNDTVIVQAASTAVTLARDPGDTDTLVISFGEARLKINKYFVIADAQDDEAGHIETITFSDGTSWDLAKVLEALGRPMPTEPEDKVITGRKGKDVLTGEDGNDTIDGGKGNDVLRGGAGHDLILGGKGNDKLFGGAGDDTLDGGAGTDTLVGGAGADVFRFGGRGDSSPGKKRDVILDFESGVDKIDLSGIDANARKKGDDAFTALLSGKDKFTSAGQMRYDAKKGILYLNTDKDAAAEFEIHLKNKPAFLKLSDFIL